MALNTISAVQRVTRFGYDNKFGDFSFDAAFGGNRMDQKT
jgi:hypothetical protein